MPAPTPRPAVAEAGEYGAGRSAASAVLAPGVTRAVKLASNESPFPPHPAVLDAIARAAHDANRYPDPASSRLRTALADRHGVDNTQVLVGAGSVGVLYALAHAYLRPGDEVVMPWPAFEAYPIVAGLVEATSVKVPLHAETVDVDALIAAITPRTRAVFLAEPNNPTSTAVGRAATERLLKAVPGDCLVVLDLAYWEYHDPSERTVAADVVERFPNVVVLRTFSKAFSLAGLRVGYGIGTPDTLAPAAKSAPPFAVNAVAQAAALAALAVEQEVLTDVGRLLAERARVEAGLAQLGVAVAPSQANFVWLATGQSSAELGAQLESLGVVTRVFPDLGLRVSIGAPEENDLFLSAMLDTLEKERLYNVK